MSGVVAPASAEPPAPGPWRSYGPALGGETRLVTFHRSDPLQAYAVVNPFGGSDRSLYRTTDGGDTWWPAALEGVPDAVLFEPDNHEVGYASDSGTMLKTVDGGESWITLGGGLPASSIVRSIAIDPSAPSTVYAAADAGLFTTVDGGSSWTRLSEGLPEDGMGRRLAISPSDPATIYYSAWIEEAEASRLFRSADRGATWSSTSLSAENSMTFSVAPTDPSTLYAAIWQEGLRVSNDGGETWRELSSPSTGVPWTVAVHPASSETVYLGATDGVFLTRNGGSSWTRIGDLPTGVEVHALAISPAEPASMLAGTCCYMGGVYRSEDAGASWQVANHGLDGDSNIWSVAAHASGVVYAGANGGASAELSVFRGSAWGRRWHARDWGIPPDVWIRSMAVSPVDPDVAFAAAGTALYRTTNGGGSWSTATLPTPSAAHSVAIAPSNAQVVYAGGAYTVLAQGAFGTAVFKSTDGGATWTTASRGLPPAGEVSDLEVDPTNPNVVYAAVGNAGVFKSTDGGSTWLNHRVGIRSTGVLAVAVDPVNPQIVYAGGTGTTVTEGTGVYKSTNGGLLWLPTTLAGAAISSIAIDPTDPRRVFATQYRSGQRVMMSADAGQTWSPMVQGLEDDLIIPNIAIDPSGDRLYATSGGRGVFVADL